MPSSVVISSAIGVGDGGTTVCILPEPHGVPDDVAPASSSSSSPPPSSLIPNTAEEQLLESKPAPNVDDNEECDNVVFHMHFSPSFSDS